VRRTYKFQAKPTAKQQVALAAMLSDHCTLYNAALQERRDAYRHSSKTSVRYGDQSAQLKAIRDFDAACDPTGGQSRWSFSSQQATLRRLNRSFEAFYRRVKAGQTPGFPRFRAWTRFDTVEFPKDGDGIKWNSQPDRGTTRTSTWTHVRVQGIGHIKVNQHRPIPDGARVKTVSIKREGGTRRPRWFIVVSCDDVPAQPLASTGAVIGLDLATGENGLAYTSDSNRLDNPRHLHRAADRLAAAQRDLARKKSGSRNRRKAAERVARLHAKVARARLDHLHKTAAALIADHDLIAVEALTVANMTRRAKPVPDLQTPGTWLPNGGSAKTGLNKSILDAGWGIFLALLHAKAESAGRAVIEVDPRNTSRTCSACGHLDPDARTGKRYTCTNPGCTEHGIAHDADINAATNILRAGLAQFQTAQAA
jgi:putative transposase